MTELISKNNFSKKPKVHTVYDLVSSEVRSCYEGDPRELVHFVSSLTQFLVDKKLMSISEFGIFLRGIDCFEEYTGR